MKSIKIGHKIISEKSPVFIIAEAGVNHNGSLKLAKKLIDTAARAKVDAVKFQTFNPETLITKTAAKTEYQTKNDNRAGESQYEMLKRLMLPREWHKGLKQYAEKRGLIFLSTPFSIDDAYFLRKLKVKAIKVGSTDTENIPYLQSVAKFGLPIIISTGMSGLKEIKQSVNTIRKHGCNNIVAMQCTSNYPTPYEESNLKAIITLKKELGLLVGYSDHTKGIEAPIAAVAMGAKVIEKHFTLDRRLPGPDHSSSLEPNELKQMVTAIRNTEKALGTGKKTITKNERRIAAVARKSIVAATVISAGKKITHNDIAIKRPGTGIAPKFVSKVIGKTAKISIKKDQLLNWKMLK